MSSVLDEADAQREFSELVERQATKSLWFLHEPTKISLTAPDADVVLESIVRHGALDAWRQAKKLQAWRSRNIR